MDVSWLLGQLKNLSATIDGANKACWKAIFPRPDGADYTIVAYIYADGGADISAKRYGSPNEEYFCSMPFEQADFSTVQELQESFVETLMLLLENQTRIIQVRGLLFINFLFDCFIDGEWLFAGGGGGFKFDNFKFPKIEGKEKEYRSPPVSA